MTMETTRRYSDLKRFDNFEDRYEYLKLTGEVGATTFGFDRYLNQMLYHSPQWKKARRDVIIRDNGCDLGVEGRDLHSKIIIHHMNPITVEDVENMDPKIFDPEFLICVSQKTHNAIHYGDKSQLAKEYEPRRPGDTCPWK